MDGPLLVVLPTMQTPGSVPREAGGVGDCRCMAAEWGAEGVSVLAGSSSRVSRCGPGSSVLRPQGDQNLSRASATIMRDRGHCCEE